MKIQEKSTHSELRFQRRYHSEPSNKKQKLDKTQNHEQYFYLAQCCNRYNICDRAGAVLATSVLIDHGIIEPNDTKLVIDRGKLQREQMCHREEKRRKRTVW